MKLSFLSSLALAALSVTLVQAEEPKCHNAARECTQQIRKMLGGRRYLGIQVVELKPGLVIKSVLPDSPAARSVQKGRGAAGAVPPGVH